MFDSVMVRAKNCILREVSKIPGDVDGCYIHLYSDEVTIDSLPLSTGSKPAQIPVETNHGRAVKMLEAFRDGKQDNAPLMYGMQEVYFYRHPETHLPMISYRPKAGYSEVLTLASEKELQRIIDGLRAV